MRRSSLQPYHGLSLGSVLLVLVVLSTLLFGLAAAGLTHYQVFVAQFNRSAAARAAGAIVARGLVELRRNPQWGKDRNVTLEVKYESSRGEVVGSLSFVAGSAPYSTNNLEAAQSQGWNGKAVPPEFIHLVGVGKCRGQQQVVEAWYHAPTYPWAIAAGGPVRLTGGARIAGLPHVPAPGQAVNPADLGPADLRCNGDSVLLGKGTEVYGDVLTSGHVEVEPGANLTVGPVAPVTPLQDSVWVRGAIKDGTGEPEIAGVDLGRFDPVAAGLGHSTLREDRYDELYTVGDTRRREGNVEFSSGLKMDGGLLFVEGDLTVRGGMTGSGMVVCTGRVTVEGASSLASGSGVALVAGGEVALTGSGSDGSYFQGLVYTDTGFSADKVSLVGALVSRGTGAVELHEAQMLMPEELPKEWSAGGAQPTSQNWKITVSGYDWWAPVINPTRLDADHIEVKLQAEGRRMNDPPISRKVVLDQSNSGQAAALLADLLTPPGGLTPNQVELMEDDGGRPLLSIPKLVERLGVRTNFQGTATNYVLESNQFYRLQDRLRQVLCTEH